MAEAGARVAEARAATLTALQAEIDARGDRPFPQGALALNGAYEQLALAGAGVVEIEARLGADLAASRARDQRAGRALVGPHRTDLEIVHRERGRPAAECSTGEQKALILNLVLAQGARLSRAKSQPNPIRLRRIWTWPGAPRSLKKSRRSVCKPSSPARTKRCLNPSRDGRSACVWTHPASFRWNGE
jgi:DNA replication and repair protein RecF